MPASATVLKAEYHPENNLKKNKNFSKINFYFLNKLLDFTMKTAGYQNFTKKIIILNEYVYIYILTLLNTYKTLTINMVSISFFRFKNNPIRHYCIF